MARLRKMLGSADSPYILSLMRLIETQSNQTIADWCVSYAKENIIPIFEKAYPEDTCLKELLETFEKYRNREIELAGLKKWWQVETKSSRQWKKLPLLRRQQKQLSRQ